MTGPLTEFEVETRGNVTAAVDRIIADECATADHPAERALFSHALGRAVSSYCRCRRVLWIPYAGYRLPASHRAKPYGPSVRDTPERMAYQPKHEASS